MRSCKLCTLVCWRNVPRRPVHQGFLQAVEPARQPIAAPKPVRTDVDYANYVKT